MTFFVYLFYTCVGLVCAVNYFGPQARIVSQDGHLILYAAEHKNISFETRGRGGVHVNGVDVSKAAKISNSALEAMRAYQSNFESSFEKINRFEQLWDDGLMQKISMLQRSSNTSANVAVSSASLVRSVRRLNKKVKSLQKSLRILSALLSRDECSSDPCKNGGTCQDLFNDFICHCPPEWEGSLCDKDVNECNRFDGTDLGCQNGATCVNRKGSYECLCPHGWFGLHCTRRTTDCKSSSNGELCGHGTCVTQYNDVGYKCICDQGWTTDGKTPACNTDVNECESHKPPCSVNPLVQCINLPGSFHCGSCPTGYSGNGFYCVDIDECSTSNGGCSTNPTVQCINTLGSRICGSCPPGYVGDGTTCSFQGVCSVNNGGCHPIATCRHNPRIGSSFVECLCPAGYVGNGIGPNGCVRSLAPSGPCAPNPCRHGSCTPNGTNDYTCSCYRRYTGKNCDSFRNLCDSNPCENGATCRSFLGVSYKCICPSQYTGLRCESEKQACGGRLTNEEGILAFPSMRFQTYGHTMSCAWTIETNSSKVLNITFTKFDIEDGNLCRYDWLQIHDGKNTLAPSLGRFCGRNLPNGGTIITTHNIVYLWFRSDHSISSTGFNLTWTSAAPNCGDEYKAVTSHGIIQSPGSPGKYPNNRDCFWPLQAPAGKRILFHFFTLMIGNDSACDHDYLEFRTGTQDTDPVFAKFCNTTHPAPLFSPGSEALVHFHSDASDSYPGFQITYSVVEGMPGCGGVHTRYRDEIRSPSFNGQYPNDIQCEYKVQLPEGSRIKITFLSFALEESENCQFDSVSIYAGGNVDAPLIGKYCGRNIPSPYVTESNVLLIVFRTDWATTNGGFVMKYETACGGKYTSPTGVITSPAYPNTYPYSLECFYEIVQPLGRIIELQIVDLDMETNSFPECLYDFLEIRDGHDENATLIGTYCDRPPPLIISRYNHLWLKFQTDSSNSGRGFKANFTSTDVGCGGIMKEKSGTFSTPNYPEMYPPGKRCQWIISVPAGNVIQIVWMNFQLEKSHDCTYDYVEIFENNTDVGKAVSLGKYCGQTTPPHLLSTSNLVTIIFQSDTTYHLSGFLASYTSLQESSVCGGNYYIDAGVLKSPKYPENYPLNTECTWTIQVKPGHQIMLNVTDFSLEKYSVCRYDWLEIRNGGSAVSPLLGKYCGTSIPKVIPSHANKLYIRFRSDMTKTDRGFMIRWEATATGCGGTLNSPTGSIISPNYPEPYTVNTECTWKIFTSVGSTVQIVFSDLDLEEHTECLLDYVEILDGPTLNSKSLGRFCSSHPAYITSTSNSVIIKFRSDLSRNGRGFQLQYRIMCNNTVSGFRGVIESPNFPNYYPSSVNCNWEVLVPVKNKINISFSHFDLEKLTTVTPLNESEPTCLYDYVEILFKAPVTEYEEEGPFEKYGVYCGDQTPPLITLNAHHAKIHFVSDTLLHGNGFRLEWQIEGCGDILTHPNGTISSPNYPHAYPPSVQCNWKINVDYGNHIEITFHKVELEKTYTCNLDFITLYNGEDDTYPEIATICHQYKPITLRSSGNHMFIKFKSDMSIEGFGFTSNYTSKPTKCGGKYVADTASIMSPNYPKNYDQNDTCGYEIEVTEGHMISLTFETFDLFEPANHNCSANNISYVKVYDGPTINYPVLAKICGRNATQRTIVSTTNQMYVEMVTQTANVAKGFLAKYAKSCGARIETDGTGTIRINPRDFDIDQFNCSWIIVARDPSKHVSLTVTHLDNQNYFCDDNISSLKIYNGDSPHAPILGSYCGNKIPPTLTSDGSALYIETEYNVILFATYSVFDSHCGGTLTSIEGFFASPGYPKKYPMETECEWTIEVAEGNHVTLSFIYFEMLDSENCNTDYLEIRSNNGTGRLLGTFCGNNFPTNITNAGSLWLFLKTSQFDGDVSGLTAKGFYAEYMLNHVNELSGPSGRIVSPLYDRDFPFYGEYSWRISVNFGKRILLTFKEMHLESSSDMCFTSINVYDGPNDLAPLLNEYCGNSVPNSIKSSSNNLYIKFESYSTTRSSTRFIVEWMETDSHVSTSTSKNKSKSCGSQEPIDLNALKNLTKVSSPGYPDGYGPDLLCEWVFTTIPMNRLKIYFVEMDLQPSYGTVCYADYVEIFEKRLDSEWTSVLKTCHENVTSRSYIYTSNIMKIVFKSDRFANRTGFMAYVRESCGGSLSGPSGHIIFDNNTRIGYGLSYITECQWNITVRVGRTIELKFLEFDIHHDQDKGCDNYLLVRNGKFSDSPILGQGKYCGKELPPNLQTTSNNAYIKFTGFTSLANFKIRYHEISYECGGAITLTDFDRTTQINSPNYPNSPPPHIECVWRIMAPPGEVIRIDFPDRFDISSEENCKEEYLEVRDGGTPYSKLIGKFCGNKPNSRFTSDNMMFVKFFTELNDPSNGFKAQIALANCGGTINDKFGQIQSPFFNSPKQYPVGANCTWHVKSPPDHNMILQFVKIDLEEAQHCTSVDHVEIHEDDLVDNGVNSLGNFCGKAVPQQIKTSGSEAIIHFETSKNKKELGGFALQFNASLDACGGTIEASEGTIQSPGYPNPHKNYRRCNWFIKVPRGRRVTLQVEDYDMDSRMGKSWLVGLSIFTHENYRGFIKKITADDSNKSVESTDNTLVVLYWSKGNSGRGFKAKFTSNQPSVCDGDLNEDSGVITQPKVNYTYYCTYIRNKPPTPSITLSMTITTENSAVSAKKTNCYLFTIQIQSAEGQDPLAIIECAPSTTVVRSPYSFLKVEAMEYSSKTPVNYTISYRTYKCGGVVNGETGTIKSPGYPNKYSESMECSWLLRLPQEQSILLTFEGMDLGDNCEKSYLDIFNGNSPRSPKIDRYCQTNKPVFLRSQSNSLWIDYKYDQDSNGKGFSVKYEPDIRGCGGIFHDRTRIIQSPSFPNDYPNNAECLWELRSDEGYHIGLIFTTRFQIEQSDNCENDYLEIWDWKDDHWYSLGKKCGREFPESVNSTSNRMKIMFRSNERIAGKGFRAQWEWNCGGTFVADNVERFIVSPGFPTLYKSNLYCQYNISAKNSQFVNIKFYQFDLEGSGSNCRFDNITISNIWRQGNMYRPLPLYKQVFCGQRGPPSIRLTNTIYILFQTDKWVQRTGYKFSYQLDDCGGNINIPTVINSPVMNSVRTPGLYNGYMNCVWNITAPPKKTIVIQFQEFSFNIRKNCYFDNVEIYDGAQIIRSNRIANLCGDLSKSLPVIKTARRSAIVSLKTDRTLSQEGFKAEVYFADDACGGSIKFNTTTTITAPDLVDMDCSWTVQSPVGTNIKIHFDELNLPSSCGLTNHTHTNCSCALLEIKDGHPAIAELIEKLCGLTSTSFTREVTTTRNILGLRLRTRGSNSKAFKVTLRSEASICGPIYLNVTNEIQTLVSPGYPNKYPSDLRCSWVITGSGKFMIHFVDFDLNEENYQQLLTDSCNEDKFEIIDSPNNHVLEDGLGPALVVLGNRKTTADFSRYISVSGTHQFCGKTEKPFDYHSNINSLVLKFTSGNIDRNRGKGFKLEYHLSGCNRNYTSLQGRIVNSFNKECFQTITSDNCEKGGLEIRDGGDRNAPLLQRMCGYALPNPVFSSTNKLWLYSWLATPNKWSATFNLVYTSSDQGRGCGGTLYNYQGSFTSPMYPMGYRDSTPCVWDVRVPFAMRVAIKFQTFDIQGECESNYVKITTYDKDSSNDHKYCTNENPATLYSNSHLLLTYQSSISNNGSGWHVLFEAVGQ